MPPAPYSFIDSNSRSHSHLENSEEVEYEDEMDEVRSRGRTPPSSQQLIREEVKRRESVKEERAPISAIINVFDHNKRGREMEEE